MKRVLLQFLMIISFTMMLVGPNLFASDKMFPFRSMEYIIATGPGSGGDRLIRMIKNIMVKNKLVDVQINVINKPGGAGLVGGAYLEKKRGDGHALFIVNNLIFLNDLYGRTPKGYHYTNQLTPLATLMTEWCSLQVRSNSKYKNISMLMEDLQKNPKTVSFGVPLQGSDHHLSLMLIAKSYNIDPKALKVVAYSGAGEMVPAILGGHVDVISLSPSTMIEHKRAGKVRYLVVASEERLKGELADVPTWKEMGHDIVFPHWRGVVGPPDMPADAIAWWDDALAKFIETPEWQGIMKHLGWDFFYKNSQDTAEFWRNDYLRYQELVKSAGLYRKK